MTLAFTATLCLPWNPIKVVAQKPVVKRKSQPKPKPPRLRQYDQKRKTFLRHSREKDRSVQQAAIYNLCQLHWIVTSDPRFQTHDKLKGIRVSIASRLKEWRRRQLVVNRSDQDSNAVSSGDYSSGESVSPEDDSRQTSVAAETSVAMPFCESPADAIDHDLLAALSSSSRLMGDLTGGPRQLFRYHGGQFGAPWDHAPELIAIIQSTVNPDVWDRAGGNATIRYYQPALALIIRAPQKTHDDICELLNKLRAAF